jgi:RNA polymerase sigma factor (TIGR02999 family)
MSDVTHVLSAIEKGDPHAAEKLLPLVYDELRKLAAQAMAQESPGQTLQATALVHEAYIRLVDREQLRNWESRGHFFAAAAESMRRILIENARRKQRIKRGGGLERRPLDDLVLGIDDPPEELLELDAALSKLTLQHPARAELVKLRYFAGLTNKEAAKVLEISPSTADRDWTYARAWLYREIDGRRKGGVE